MTESRRRAALALLALAVVCSALALVGHAASLGVSAARLDGFGQNQAAPTTTVPSDTTAPGLTALQMFDVNANGKIDRVVATFNEALQASTSSSGWSFSGAVPSSGTLASVAVVANSNQATVTLTEGGGAPDTAVGTFQVALALATSDIKDATGNKSSFGATSPTDKAAPALVTLEAFDNRVGIANNGKIDRVTAVFSENLATYTAGAAPWGLDNAPGGAGNTVSSVNVSGTTATLDLGEGAVNTAVGAGGTAFRVDLAAVATGIRDSATNLTSFVDAAVADRANPVFLDFTDSDTGVGGGNGLIEDDDWIEFEFSEPINLSSAADPANVKMDDNNTTSDRLAIQGLFGATALGSNGYITKQNKDADFLGSDLTQNGRVVRVDLSGCTGNGCGDRGTSSGDVTLTILTSVTGIDGRSVIGSVTKTGYAMF